MLRVHSSLKVLNHQSGRHQAVCSTTKLKTSHGFQVSVQINCESLFIVDEIKWGLRFPTKFAMREHTLSYEDKVQEQILAFLGKNIAIDYLDGSREVDLDLTLKEAEMLFNANDKIREMAANGELQAFHKRCSDTQSAVETGYTNVMDQLDRILKQISEMEDEVYDDMRETENLDRLRSHQPTSVIDTIALSGGNVALENYLIIKGLAATKDEGS